MTHQAVNESCQITRRPMIIPAKLSIGCDVRVIAPSRSMSIVSDELIQIAWRRLADMGLSVSFGHHTSESDAFDSTTVESRLADLHDAFTDANVKAVITIIGGYNSNQLLQHIDYDLIRDNPKILCGYSDITALQNAIWSITGLVTYYGPHFSTFGMLKGIDYIVEQFQKCLWFEEPFEVASSEHWSNDRWWIDQEKRRFFPNQGHRIWSEGNAEGTLVGGNLSTLALLTGTTYMPCLQDVILLVEEDDLDREVTPSVFDRRLQSLTHQPGFSGVRGLIVGRFPVACAMDDNLLGQILRSKRELRGIPVISNVDFGHTIPMATLPIGGKVRLTAKSHSVRFKILSH